MFPIMLPLRACAVMPLKRAWRDRNLGRRFYVRYAAQAVAYDFDLSTQLRAVIHLLKVAAAAAPEVGAGRLYTRVRRLYDFYYGSEGNTASHIFYANTREVPRRCKADHDCAAAFMRKP
jgi:hypothetical protein